MQQGEGGPARPQGPRLLDRVRQALHCRHYSLRTEKAYVAWIKRYIVHHGKRHPAEMGRLEVEQFLSHLVTARRASASTQNQALSALLFLYREVLGLQLEIGDVARPRPAVRVPLVLSPTEVAAVLHRLHGTCWLMCALMYGAGLRLPGVRSPARQGSRLRALRDHRT